MISRIRFGMVLTVIMVVVLLYWVISEAQKNEKDDYQDDAEKVSHQRESVC